MRALVAGGTRFTNLRTMEEHPPAASPPALVVMVGPPGTGKSHLVRQVRSRVPAATVQSDEIRRSMIDRPQYTPDENRRVFRVAHDLTERMLRGGESVIFDATNLRERNRRELYEIAERAGARVLVVHVIAPDSVVAERLRTRLLGVDPDDRSEAGWDVYLRMKAEFEEIQRPHLVVDSSREIEPAVDQVVRFIEGRP